MGEREMAIVFVCIAMLFFTAMAQRCVAQTDEERVEEVLNDFFTAYAESDYELMMGPWSHEDDVRNISTAPPGLSVNVPSGLNSDARGWAAVEHTYNVRFREMHITGSFKNVAIEITGDKALVTFDSVVWGISNKASIVLMRKEGSEWKIYTLDLDGLTANLSGEESGEYVEIAFEAEDGEGATDFLESDVNTSKGVCVTGEANCFFRLNIPEPDEYTIWCRTHAPSWPISLYKAKVDEEEFRGWAAYCDKWAWSQLNQEGIEGPKLFTLDAGEHTVTFSSPKVPGYPGMQGGSKFDAIYITNNLSLRADQIQRRFELTRGYMVEESKAVESDGKAATTWARHKADLK